MKFNLNRFGKLLKRDWLLYKKPLGYGLLAALLLLISIVLINTIGNDESLRISFWFELYSVFLIVGGAVFTSIIYWEFRNPAGRINYLTLPASHLEKVLTRGLYTFLLYPAVLTILFFFTFKLTEFVDGPAYMDTQSSFYSSKIILLFCAGHPLVFMFAIWINKYVAGKTALIGLAAAFVFTLVYAILFRIIFSEVFVGLEMTGHFRMEPKEGFQDRVIEFWEPLLRRILIAFSIILFWTVAYFKMKEKEA